MFRPVWLTDKIPITASIADNLQTVTIRLGDLDNSTVSLNDYRLIEELSFIDQQPRKGRLQTLGDEAAVGESRNVPEVAC
jgi:hypothetical protein